MGNKNKEPAIEIKAAKEFRVGDVVKTTKEGKTVIGVVVGRFTYLSDDTLMIFRYKQNKEGKLRISLTDTLNNTLYAAREIVRARECELYELGEMPEDEYKDLDENAKRVIDGYWAEYKKENYTEIKEPVQVQNTISKATLKEMDEAIENMKEGKVSPAVVLDELDEMIKTLTKNEIDIK